MSRSFYDRDVVAVARDLLGKTFFRRSRQGLTCGTIVEVEAYVGESDPACHAAAGFTFRNAPLYGRPGLAYVYLIYGMHYLLNAVTLIDTAAQTYEVVDLPDEVQYTFRDIARGPGDLAYILASDGQIHVLDPETGELTDAYPVVEAWEGPVEWQDAHPAIKVAGDIAYVTEPAANSVHAVDLTTGEIVSSVELDHTPNEIAIS